MIISLVTTAAENGTVHVNLPDRADGAPWTFDDVMDCIDAASTESGRYIGVRSREAVLTSYLDRSQIVAILVPLDVALNGKVLLEGVIDGPRVEPRRPEKVHPAL